MTKLLFEHMGCARADGVLNNYRSRCAVITADNRLMIADVGSCCTYNFRTTNKRNGKPLKNGVYEIKNDNALWIDGSIKRAEARPSDNRPYMASYGIGPAMREKLAGLSYTVSDILKAFEIITGKHYDGVEIVDHVEIPAEYESIKAAAFQQVKEKYIEEQALKIANDFIHYTPIKGLAAFVNKKVEALEAYSGTTEADKKRIAKQVQAAGWREKNYFSSDRRAVVNLGRDGLFRVYNLTPDSAGVVHYFEITKDGRITG